MFHRYLMTLAGLALVLTACGAPAPSGVVSPTTAPVTTAATAATAAPAAETTAAAPSGGEAPTAAAGLQPLTLGLGYIPNVQFAPFYVAATKGFYAEEGLQVDFSYGGNVNDLLLQTASRKIPFVMAAGDEVLLARSQGVPVKMVFLLYQKAPVALFSGKAAAIAQPADLRGKTVGIPGRYGATYIGLRGLLHAAGLQETDVTISEIGFTQFEAVSQGTVPAAMGYANNEPLRMQEAGTDVNVIRVADHIQLVSNGVVTSEQFAQEQPELLRKFLRATRRGLETTITNPAEAFTIALTHIPELGADRRPFERKVLEETLAYWRTEQGAAPGALNPAAWTTTYTFLKDSGILTRDTDPEQAYTEEFLK